MCHECYCCRLFKVSTGGSDRIRVYTKCKNHTGRAAAFGIAKVEIGCGAADQNSGGNGAVVIGSRALSRIPFDDLRDGAAQGKQWHGQEEHQRRIHDRRRCLK